MVFFECGLYMTEIYFVENIRFTADLDFKYNSTFDLSVTKDLTLF